MSMERMNVDFLGNEIKIGDRVIFEAPKYRDFAIGKVITMAEKTCQIEYVNDWNYRGRKEVVRQFYCQIIKHPADVAPIKKSEWISVKDRLPEDEKNVLCYYGFDRGDGDLGMMFIGTLCYFCFDKNPHWQHASHNLVVTHWMPLPQPPKGV